MKTRTLKAQIIVAFLVIITVISSLIAVLGYYVIQHDILARARKEVINAINAAKSVYAKELDLIKMTLSLADTDEDLMKTKKLLDLDYVYQVPIQDINKIKSDIAREAFSGNIVGGTRLITEEELASISEDMPSEIEIKIKDTLKAKPSNKKILENALVMEAALPVKDERGIVSAVLYGGRIINKDFSLVDEIRDLVFENELYGEKPLGTVTIFQDDVRISTNVLNAEGQRAIGTRVSKDVYDEVVGSGNTWLDRAFVVTDWYITAYEPIKNIQGDIIGILYVGILEKPFIDLERNFFLIFLLIILFVSAAAVIFSFTLASRIAGPVREMTHATSKISGGVLDYRLNNKGSSMELDELTASFNKMSEKIKERESSLKIANEKLEILNKSYLDMIGFVSHELKGILGSIVMNIYSVKEGYLGELNEKQKKAVDSASKSLDHFENMVKNYLDLSRIEKGELKISKSEVNLNPDIIKPVVEHFEKMKQNRHMSIDNMVSDDIALAVDKSLFTIACNNLLGNALKYGKEGGRITISSKKSGEYIALSFYNDGNRIKDSDKKLIFKRFSRLPGSEDIKGTGLGLFIVKEIIEKHGGTISVESKENGNEFVINVCAT